MGLMDDFRADIDATKKKRRGCKLCAALEKMSPEDVADVARALKSREITDTAVARVLIARGHDLTTGATKEAGRLVVERHRRGNH